MQKSVFIQRASSFDNNCGDSIYLRDDWMEEHQAIETTLSNHFVSTTNSQVIFLFVAQYAGGTRLYGVGTPMQLNPGIDVKTQWI